MIRSKRETVMTTALSSIDGSSHVAAQRARVLHMVSGDAAPPAGQNAPWSRSAAFADQGPPALRAAFAVGSPLVQAPVDEPARYRKDPPAPMMHKTLRSIRAAVFTAVCALTMNANAAFEHPAPWFEAFKDHADKRTLLEFLHAMPKGGDLHNHITGAVFAEWWLELGVAAEADGYRYLTKTRIENCAYGTNEFGPSPYLLLWRTISERTWQTLSACEQQEYTPLSKLNAQERAAFASALHLDRPHEGRAEFFSRHWQRINELTNNPHIVAEIIARNLIAFGEEGLLYLEAQVPVFGMRTADGEPLSPDAVLDIYRARIAEADVEASGMTLRMQISLLRFTPQAEENLKRIWGIAARHEDVVAVNFVGREDDDKGHPARFLGTVRALRREYSGVHLSIHAGEVDEPNDHIRDTLLLGAERIGHGVNLITQPDVMLYMRDRHLVEINLISNLLLEYVDDYDEHPFPEYLRFGIPVALSTDDRGMWDSTMTDEFLVAVREFDLSWQELVYLSRNSIRHSFLEDEARAALLEELNDRLSAFETAFRNGGLAAVRRDARPLYRGFICRRYDLCEP